MFSRRQQGEKGRWRRKLFIRLVGKQDTWPERPQNRIRRRGNVELTCLKYTSVRAVDLVLLMSAITEIVESLCCFVIVFQTEGRKSATSELNS